MAAPIVSAMSGSISARLRNQLNDYGLSLQARHGDPRQYARERQEAAQATAAKEHMVARSKEELLEKAYARQVQKNREAHAANASKRKIAPKNSEARRDTPQ